MELALGIIAILVLAPCLPELRVFVKTLLRDINGEGTPNKK